MDLNVKLLGLVAAVALLIGGVYWMSSQTAAQGELVPQPAEASNPGHSNPDQDSMAMGGMGSDGMGMMGSQMGQMGQMDMAAMMEMMQQMQAQMAQMMEACQQMMANMGMNMEGMGSMSGMDSMAMPEGTMGSAELSEEALTRTSMEAGIAVDVTFLNPLLPPEETEGKLVFRVALNTHSGDLLQYDLTKLAVLRTGEGLTVEGGFVWEPESESGHHRMGLLTVSATVDGQPLITEGTEFLELELKDIGVPSRVFRWEGSLLVPSKAE